MNNRDQGNLFEAMFKKRAQSNGLLAEKNHLTARYLPNGRVRVCKSDLDYRVITQQGRVGYFDCKSFLKGYFTYSDINPDQIERSLKYEHWSVSSGFVVWFRQTNQVVLIKASDISRKGKGQRFDASDGLLLGSIELFDLKLIMK